MRKAITIMLFSFSIIIATGALSVLFIVYGPFPALRDLTVTSFMTTMKHKYFVETFFGKRQINDVMSRNSVIEEESNPTSKDIDKIKTAINNKKVAIIKDDNEVTSSKDNKVVIKPQKNNVKVEKINGGTFTGYLMTVENPEKVIVATSDKLGKRGLKISEMVSRNNAEAGINAGGFSDTDGHGTGGSPSGIIIHNGKVTFRDISLDKYGIIGFNYDNVLILGSYTYDQIQNLKLRDAVSFHPFLIVDGKSSKIRGNGGWGLGPRTAIGQKADGTVLLLVVDGRQVSSLGATVGDIQHIMLKHGAVNASCLDGGSSTVMYYGGKIVNHPSSKYGDRYLPSAFVVLRGHNTETSYSSQ